MNLEEEKKRFKLEQLAFEKTVENYKSIIIANLPPIEEIVKIKKEIQPKKTFLQKLASLF